MSALDGTLEVGDIVWQQMYEPTKPSWDATLEERIAGGLTYGKRRQMRLVRIYRDGIDGPCPNAGSDGLHPLSGNPMDPHSEHYYCVSLDGHDESWTDNNWCVLEHADTDGALW